jgi:phosphoadenosine phosphosulfate reductase
MRYVIIEETMEEMRQLSERHSGACAVSFSAGKDSLVVLDLALRMFPRVVAFSLYFVPGLRCFEEPVERYAAHFGVEVLRYPHFAFFRSVSDAIYCDSHWKYQESPRMKLLEVFNAVRAENSVRLILSGAKKSDGPMRRRRMFADQKAMDESVVYPLKDWLKYDVMSYLKLRSIPLPEETGKVSFGVDLSTPSILALHDRYPEDFSRLESYFPYIRAVVERRKMYGVK